MRLVTRAILIDRYGVRLTMEQLAECLDWTTNSVYNAISAGEFPIATYKEGKRRFADYEEVARYFDAKAAEAKKDPGD